MYAIKNEELHQAFDVILAKVFRQWSTSDMTTHTSITDME